MNQTNMKKRMKSKTKLDQPKKMWIHYYNHCAYESYTTGKMATTIYLCILFSFNSYILGYLSCYITGSDQKFLNLKKIYLKREEHFGIFINLQC